MEGYWTVNNTNIISWLKTEYKWILIGWLKTSSVQSFQPIILIYWRVILLSFIGDVNQFLVLYLEIPELSLSLSLSLSYATPPGVVNKLFSWQIIIESSCTLGQASKGIRQWQINCCTFQTMIHKITLFVDYN